jgi:CheY-like chemotaxis protein
MPNIRLKNMQKIHIIWADDEIDLLKPHIAFLKAKGYDVTPINNGYDAVAMVRTQPFDLVFLDENMPGISGLEALQQIKTLKPNLPVVMISKSEEEHIMEEAIGAQIADYLIKPVNPNQIWLSIKKIMDSRRLISEKTTSDYQQEFTNIGISVGDNLNATQWAELYDKLCAWEIKLHGSDDHAMHEIFNMQKAEANKQFCRFVSKNYLNWLKNPADPHTPVLSHNVIQKKMLPLLQANDDPHTPVFLVLIDNLRLDQFKILHNIIEQHYRTLHTDTYYAILPTCTEYARNALFAGMMPSEIQRRYADRWAADDTDEHSRNTHEDFLLTEQLKRYGKQNIKHSYTKITNLNSGKQLTKNAKQMLQNQLNVVVYNFVDLLSHARTEMRVIKELAEDEAAYRSITKSWFENSPLLDFLKYISQHRCKLIITTDHGSVRVHEPVRIVGDRETTTNLRFKEGKSLSHNHKSIFEITNPDDALLPKPRVSSTYAIATADTFFVYPNNYNQYVNLYENTFQHGGISLEEMIVPFAVFETK